MKIFAQTLFSGTSISTANTASTCAQFDVSEVSKIWLQLSATGTDSTTDCSIQMQLSNHGMNVPAADSVWVNDGASVTFTGTAMFDKHYDVDCVKARVSVTRNSGACAITIISVGKPV